MEHMDHMEHGGGHEGHSMPMPMPACTMSMIWNTNTTGMCIVHPAWHVGTSQAFVGSLIVVFALAVLYEYGKWAVRCVDMAIVQSRASPGRRGARRGLMLEDDEDVSNASGLRRNRPSSTRRGPPGDTILTIDAREEAASEPSSSRLSPTSLIATLYVPRKAGDTDQQTTVAPDAGTAQGYPGGAVRRKRGPLCVPDAGDDDLQCLAN